MDDPFELPAAHPGDPGRDRAKRRWCNEPSTVIALRHAAAVSSKGVGPRRAADLERVGLHTVEDLLYRFPDPLRGSRHVPDDRVAAAGRRRRRSPARSSAAACARRAGRASRSSSCSCATSTGALRAIWLNQPFLRDVFRPHQRVVLFGKLELTSHGLQMQNPQYEILPQDRRTEREAGRRRPTTRRSTPAASSRSTRRPARSRRRCSAARARRAGAAARRPARSAAGGACARASSCSTGATALARGALSARATRRLDELNAFRRRRSGG